MPTYTHACRDDKCNFEWEDFYSITKEPPKICPKCNQETAVRTISGGSGRGIVELTGQDLTDKMKADTQQLKKDIHRDENKYANLLGPDKYQQLQTQMDRNKRNR